MRARQLTVRTLLAGMCLTQADGRRSPDPRAPGPGQLPADDQRLGVLADWKHGPRLPACRQTEYTFGLVTGAPGKAGPAGLPSGTLQEACDGLLEASVSAGRSPPRTGTAAKTGLSSPR